jgi:hypothetical protein
MPTYAELTCAHCGKHFYRRAKYARGAGPFYCSCACAGRHQRRSAEQRFWAGVRRSADPDGCWEWVGVRPRSRRAYSCFLTDDGRQVSVARFAYELHRGPIPGGHKVGHTYGNRGCVNPEHLFATTQHEIRLKARHSDRRGERNHNAKLTWRKVRRIRARHAAGETIPNLAKVYGVDPSAVWQVVHGRTWKEPPPHAKAMR